MRGLIITSLARTQKKQGFTILELMVAITLSSMLALAVYVIYQNAKRSYAVQSDVSEVRDAAFILMDQFDYSLKQAGFINYSETQSGFFNATNSSIPSFSSTFTKRIQGKDDEIGIQLRLPVFQNGQEALACGGARFPSPIDPSSIYQLVYKINPQQQLTCQVFKNDAAIAGSGVSILADNILRMKAFYQIRANPTQNACNGDWQRADQIMDWNLVCAVHIGLVVGSERSTNKSNPSTFELAPTTALQVAGDSNFTLNPVNGRYPVARMLHKVVYLRN